ncbi:MAG TPA: urease accessory protein UreD, partial [Actinoplanes sp.]|nr:urease accessory protein UreD [Actinoplanes sp.]
MRARARIVATADAAGGTRLAVLHGEAPLLLRRTRGPGTVVHLVGGAAGPLGGDDLRLDVEVGPGAQLSVRSVAASIALPGPGGAASGMHVRATVAAGAVLHWQPEPLIAAAGCNHDAVTEVHVADGGAVTWRDDVVCGRHGETPGDVRINTLITYAGRTLHRHELFLGPSAPGWAGAAVLGGARALGTVVVVNPAWAAGGPPPAAVLAPDAAAMPLTGPA